MTSQTRQQIITIRIGQYLKKDITDWTSNNYNTHIAQYLKK